MIILFDEIILLFFLPIMLLSKVDQCIATIRLTQIEPPTQNSSPTARPIFLWSSNNPMGLVVILYELTGNGKCKMAAFNLEILRPISQLLDKISTTI